MIFLNLTPIYKNKTPEDFCQGFFSAFLMFLSQMSLGLLQASLREMIYGNLLKAHQLVLLKTRGL